VFGDVAFDCDVIHNFTRIIPDRRYGGFFRIYFAILFLIDESPMPGGATANSAPEFSIKIVVVLAAVQEAKALSQSFPLRVSRDRFERRVDVLNKALGICNHDNL